MVTSVIKKTPVAPRLPLVYLLRYGILDWSPTYLKEVKHFALDKSSWAYFLYEYAGIPGTLICGWMSDKVFKGNRDAPY